MDDFLLRPPTIPAIQINKPSRASLQSNSAFAASQAKPYNDGPLGTVSKTLRGANDLWQSWKDGLTSEQREKLKLQEERKRVLYQDMKNVCCEPR